jgi:predicted nucleotidyltransferase
MSGIVKKLSNLGLLTPPHHFVSDTVFEVMMGSVAYGVTNKTSDIDIYAVCVPPKNMVFPHLDGNVPGFGPPPEIFSNYQKHHMYHDEAEYDVSVFSIVKYFNGVADNNPNMIDSLFVPARCIINSTDAGSHMRLNRHLFLSKRVLDRLRGYAFSELKKLNEADYEPTRDGKRKDDIKKYGYDVKSGYHVVRLLMEAETILSEGDLDLERHKEQLKFVRNGGYSLTELNLWFKSKETELSTLCVNSMLRTIPNYEVINTLLLECLEIHYGSISEIREKNKKAEETLNKIRDLLEKHK